MRKRCYHPAGREGIHGRKLPQRLLTSESVGGSTALAFAFITPDYAPYLEEFSEMVRVDGHVIELVGATGAGLGQ
jgi:hypothetical protein